VGLGAALEILFIGDASFVGNLIGPWLSGLTTWKLSRENGLDRSHLEIAALSLFARFGVGGLTLLVCTIVFTPALQPRCLWQPLPEWLPERPWNSLVANLPPRPPRPPDPTAPVPMATKRGPAVALLTF